MTDFDMYSEPGHATLRQMMKDEPEWAVNRLVAEKQRADKFEAEVKRLREAYRSLGAVKDDEAEAALEQEAGWNAEAHQAMLHFGAKLAAAEAQVERLREALTTIEAGTWNVGRCLGIQCALCLEPMGTETTIDRWGDVVVKVTPCLCQREES